MANYAKEHEKHERTIWDIDIWKRRLLEAQAYRRSIGWDDQAAETYQIRRNDLPLTKMSAAPEWKGQYYVDNWLMKSIKWLVSMQTGSEVEIDIKSYDGIMSENQENLELETNFAFDAFQFMDTIEDCLYDRYYPGFGVARGIFDPLDIRPQFLTGSPRLEYVTPMNVYFDPAARKRDKTDMRWLFHQEYYDIYELKERYPKYAAKIQEKMDEKRPETHDLVQVVTVQYRRKIEFDKVFIEDRDGGNSQDFLAEEWEDYVAEKAKDPDIIATYQQLQPPEPFAEWMAEGRFLPERVVMLGPVKAMEPAVFQAIFIDDYDLVLEYPQYVGRDYSYFILPGNHDPESAYPLGLAHYMKGALNMSIIMMTVLSIQAVKYHRAKELIQEGSLVNQDDYLAKGFELGMNPIVRSDWQAEHPGQRAVEPVPMPEFPHALQMLNEQLINIQKTTTGAIDANLGIAQYSGQSGVQVAQLQAAARTYQREDVEGFRRFIIQIAEWLKDVIVLYRNYPHRIQGVDNQNRVAMIDIATHIGNRLHSENYYVDVSIQDNAEVVKQIEQQTVMQLYQMGLASDIDLLSKLEISNPEKWAARAAEYRGERQYLQAITQFPELQQLINEYVQQATANSANPAQPTEPARN